MIGLMMIAVLIAYGLFVLLLTSFCLNYGRKKYAAETSQRRAKVFFCGFAGFAIASVPVFWEAIPTYITYKIAVRQESGLKIYKTFEAWRSENPDVTTALLRQDSGGMIATSDGWYRFPLNPRFGMDTRPFKLNFMVVIHRQKIVDLKTLDVMAELTYVVSGNRGGFATGGDSWWKFWLIHSSEDDDQNVARAWQLLLEQFRGKGINQ
jgi:heme/copper-type cytochrome/quinol oxidase subunit 2